MAGGGLLKRRKEKLYHSVFGLCGIKKKRCKKYNLGGGFWKG